VSGDVPGIGIRIIRGATVRLKLLEVATAYAEPAALGFATDREIARPRGAADSFFAPAGQPSGFGYVHISVEV
jgi:hypothetical protein